MSGMSADQKIGLILLGLPGVGKGTQAALLSHRYLIPTLSTGAVLRQLVIDNKEAPTSLSKSITAIIDKGKLVNDDFISQVVKHRLQQAEYDNGFVLDGFPRTVKQAELLEEMMQELGVTPTVLYITINNNILNERISARITCKQCGTIYNIHLLPPKQEGVCDVCGGRDFIRREDDTPEVMKERLNTYHTLTNPVIQCCKSKYKFIEVNGAQKVEDVFHEITAQLDIIAKQY